MRRAPGREGAVLSGDALEVVEQLALDLALGPGLDSVHRGDEEIDQVVEDLGAAHGAERGQHGYAQGVRVAAELVGLFHGDAMAIRAEDLRRDAGEEVVRQGYGAKELELGQLLLDALEARAPGICLEG